MSERLSEAQRIERVFAQPKPIDEIVPGLAGQIKLIAKGCAAPN